MPSHQQLYPTGVARCQHIKVSGMQCNLAALKNQRLCYFHRKTQQRHNQIHANRARRSRLAFQLPLLEDLDAIQVAIMQVMHLLLSSQIEHKTAGLLLYALQTASSNMLNMGQLPEQDDAPAAPLPTPERLRSCLTAGQARAMRREFVRQGLISEQEYERHLASDGEIEPLLAAFNRLCTVRDDDNEPVIREHPRLDEQGANPV